MKAPAEAGPTESLAEFLSYAGIKTSELVPLTLLNLSRVLIEGYSVALLFPAVKIIFTGKFDGIRTARAFLFAAKMLPFLERARDRNLFLALLALFFVSSLAKICLTYFSDLAAFRLSVRFGHLLRRAVFERLISGGKLFFDQASLGHLQSMLLSYTKMVNDLFYSAQEALKRASLLPIYACALFWISWRLTLAAALAYPLLHYAQRRIAAYVRAPADAHNSAIKELGTYVHNIFSSALLVKAYSREREETAEFARRSRGLSDVESSIDLRRALVRPLNESVFPAALLLMLVAAVYFGGHAKSFRPSLLVYFYALRRLTTIFSQLAEFGTASARAHGPMVELLGFLRAESRHAVPEGAAEFPGLRGRISFVDASFAFPGDRRALRGVSFEAEKGRLTAVVGPSGAGKTTLVNVLLRFYDAPPGSILIDGRDIRGFTLASLRRRIALVDQSASLFNDTVRRNVCYGLDRRVDDGEIWDVLRRARMDAAVRAMPQGLETEIGDRGVRLSGGERQRLSIARAMLKDAETLILDEATSALDSETESRVQESMEELFRGRTAIVIAHRLSTVRNADRIVVIEEGRVAECGTRAELLSRDGPFNRYWQKQRFD